jgi:Baseplate J-like protein
MANYIPQVDFTSRDYAAIRDDLYALIPIFAPQWTNTDPADLGIAILEIFAHMGDVLNYYIDRASNESFIATASQRNSVLLIAKMLGYTPTNTSPSTVVVSFSNVNNASITLPVGTQLTSTTIINGTNTEVIFETASQVVIPAATIAGDGVTVIPGTISATAIQGQTVANEAVGPSDGTADQTYVLANQPVIDGSISVTINNTAYSYVQYLLEYAGTDPVFSTSTDANGLTSVVFGDGVSGRIPPTNSSVLVSYRYGGGSYGNVNAGTVTNFVTPIAGVTVSNSNPATGGADAESTDSIRVNAPLAASAVNRAVTLGDYAALATQVSGVAKASAAGSVFSNINLYIAPYGDPGVDGSGNLSTVFNNLALNLNTFFSGKIPPNTSLTLLPPTFVGVNLTVIITALPQYKDSTVNTAVTAALQTLFSFDNVSFNDKITLHDIISAISTVDGVLSSNVTLLARADATQSGTADAVFAVNEIPQAGLFTIQTIGGINA